MTPLDEIVRPEPRLTRLQDWLSDRARLADYLAKLDAGMRTFDAMGGQTLAENDTTDSARARWAARVVVLDERIAALTTTV